MKKNATRAALLALALLGAFGTTASAAGPRITHLWPCWFNPFVTCAYVEEDGQIVDIYVVGFKSPAPSPWLSW
jgi:hypothetical protein